MKTVKKFFNKMQRIGMAVAAHDEYWVASRGTGKSEGLDARFILRNVWAMPRSTGGLISPSYAKAWGNTLPAIVHALTEWGYREGVHYYVGHKAPRSAHFQLPKRLPMQTAWGNCIHFWNGTVLVVLSFGNGMSANSMSLDWVIGPEAKFLDYEKIKSEVNPANRGNIQDFGDCPWHHSVCYSTDMPGTKAGRWILDKREEMSAEHINMIRSLYTQMKQTEALPLQTAFTKRKAKELRRDLALARKYQIPVKPQPGKDKEYTVFYGEYDIFDNMEVVGEDYIWQMYRDSPALIWRTAFMNERILKGVNCFYSALDDHHFYVPGDTNRMSELGSDWDKLTTAGCLADGDLDYDAPILLGFDVNSAICTCAVGQVAKKTLRTLRSFFVKTPDKLDQLVCNVADYYQYKLNKEVIVFYDHTFTWTTGTNAESYIDTIQRVLEEHGCSVTIVYIGQTSLHEWRHQQIDRALKRAPDLLYPIFNLYNNEFLKLAMEQANVKVGKNGFEKDKSLESTPDTPDTPDEYKTHITDAWDTLFVGANFFLPELAVADSGVVFLGKR